MGTQQMVKRICTKEHPFVPPLKDNEVWTHEGLYEKFPEDESRIMILHCPNCGTDIDEDLDMDNKDGPSPEQAMMDKDGHAADCCRKETHSDELHNCEGCQRLRVSCKLCHNCSAANGICPHCKQKVV